MSAVIIWTVITSHTMFWLNDKLSTWKRVSQLTNYIIKKKGSIKDGEFI